MWVVVAAVLVLWGGGARAGSCPDLSPLGTATTGTGPLTCGANERLEYYTSPARGCASSADAESVVSCFFAAGPSPAKKWSMRKYVSPAGMARDAFQMNDACTSTSGEQTGSILRKCVPVPPPVCPHGEGNYLTGAVWVESAALPAGSLGCHSNCNVEAVLLSDVVGYVYQWRSLGTYCGGGEQPAVDELPQEQAVTTDPVDDLNIACTADYSTCVIPNKQNCGLVNGEYRCLGTDIPASGSCVTTASGAMFCTTDAVQPDNGTIGQAAQPDGRFRLLVDPSKPTGELQRQPFYYYSSSTVNNSVNYGGGGGGGTTGEFPESPDPGDDPGGNGQCDPATEECGPCDPATEECGTGAEFSAPEIAYRYPEVDRHIAAKKKEIAEFIVEVQNDVSEKLGGGISDAQGELPCIDFSMLGHQVEQCLSDFDGALSPMRAAVLLLGALAAGLILLMGWK